MLNVEELGPNPIFTREVSLVLSMPLNLKGRNKMRINPTLESLFIAAFRIVDVTD